MASRSLLGFGRSRYVVDQPAGDLVQFQLGLLGRADEEGERAVGFDAMPFHQDAFGHPDDITAVAASRLDSCRELAKAIAACTANNSPMCCASRSKASRFADTRQ
jgi:hypothetical protein